MEVIDQQTDYFQMDQVFPTEGYFEPEIEVQPEKPEPQIVFQQPYKVFFAYVDANRPTVIYDNNGNRTLVLENMIELVATHEYHRWFPIILAKSHQDPEIAKHPDFLKALGPLKKPNAFCEFTIGIVNQYNQVVHIHNGKVPVGPEIMRIGNHNYIEEKSKMTVLSTVVWTRDSFESVSISIEHHIALCNTGNIKQQ